MNFFTSFFSQPAMLFGTALVSVPIVIYLINRQRFRRRKWAAMEFLLRAMRKNQRRIQLENLLLLLIRCAIIALLAIAMARPFVRDRVLGSVTNQPENWIFAIDTSYSMGLRDGTRSLFETARESISRIVQSVVEPGDRVAVVTFDAVPAELLSPTKILESNRGDVLQAIADVRIGSESVNLPSSLRLATDVARRFDAVPGSEVPTSAKKLVVFSDFQWRDWFVGGESPGDDAQRPRDPSVNTSFKELQSAGVALSFSDLGGRDRNFGVTSLAMSPSIASRGVWVELHASVRNYGKEDFDALEVLFRVDDVDQPSQLVRLPAGGVVTRTLRFRFTEPGYHVVSVEARVDDLPADNRRFLVVKVRESADVLLVDGEPGVGPLERETLLLELALLPDESDEFRRAPYNPVLASVDQLALEDRQLEESVAIILANVAASDLPARFIERLDRAVLDGGALMVFLGKNVEPTGYNRVFGGEGTGMMPIELIERVERDTDPVHLEFADTEHPIARYFQLRRNYSYLEQPFIEFRRFLRFAQPPEGSPVRRLMRFDDPDRSLAVFDAPHGEGRVLWFASSADLEWNDLAKYPDFIPFLHESIPYLVGFGESRMNIGVGEPYREVFEEFEYAPQVLIIPPRDAESAAGGAPATVRKDMISEGRRFVLTHEETDFPGVYEVRPTRDEASALGEDEARPRLFAVNLDPEEGDLRRTTVEEIRGHFPDFKAEVFDAASKIKEITSNSDSAGGTELWRLCLWAVLAMLAAESVLAVVFGRKMR